MEQPPVYEKVPTVDQSEFLIDPEAFTQRPQPISQSLPSWIWLIHALLFTTAGSLILRNAAAFYPTSEQFVSQYSSYSPAAPAVQYHSVKFNGSMGADSPYVGANPASDAAWNRVTYDMGDQLISKDELHIIDKPESSLKATYPKTGVEGYRIGLEVFHQLHCLNLLRKSTFREYYEPMGGDFAESPEKLRGHLDHCIEMLRMNLMCESDIGVITFHEVLEKKDDPWPDFNTWHVCRDFEAIRDWAVENTVATDDLF